MIAKRYKGPINCYTIGDAIKAFEGQFRFTPTEVKIPHSSDKELFELHFPGIRFVEHDENEIVVATY